MVQQTLVLIKPDGLKKSLTGNVLTRLSETKLDIVAARIVKVSKVLAEQHYIMLKDKPFFNDLIKYLMGEYHKKKVMALVYWGEDAINNVRKICGSTNPEEADPLLQEQPLLAELYSASMKGRNTSGRRAGERLKGVRSEFEMEGENENAGHGCAKLS